MAMGSAVKRVPVANAPSRLDALYEFRLATLDDVDAIMAFYRAEWGATHILACDRDYFLYQHAVGERVNFMLAIHRASGEVHAAEGFIQYSRDLCDVGAVMWKVGSKCRTPMLGVEVVRRLKQATGCRVYLGPGANPKTAVPLHQRVLGHAVGRLEHFYLLDDRADFRVAVVDRMPSFDNVLGSGFTLTPVAEFEDVERRFDFSAWIDRRPYKDGWYVRRRYFAHTIYRYRVFFADDQEGHCRALLVAREIARDGATVLRIVDLVGDTAVLAGLGQAFNALLRRGGYEYLDLYAKGLDHAAMSAAGFTCKQDGDPNVIPNYFEPFVQRNVDIWYSLSDPDALLFKADGDQDRPNSRDAGTAQ